MKIIFFLLIFLIYYIQYSFSSNKIFKKSLSILKYRGGKINDDSSPYSFYPFDNSKSTSFYPSFEERNSYSSHPEFVLGKDRQLFHAVIDLKWVFSRLMDKKGWSIWLSNVGKKLKKTFYPPYAHALSYYDEAFTIGNLIYQENDQANLNVWNSNLSEALKASQTYNIPLMFYCEEEFTEMLSSLTTIKTRQMLSNPEIGNILNDKFIFLACQENHPYILNIKKNNKFIELNNTDLQSVKAPYFIVLFPNSSYYIFESTSSNDFLYKNFKDWIDKIFQDYINKENDSSNNNKNENDSITQTKN